MSETSTSTTGGGQSANVTPGSSSNESAQSESQQRSAATGQNEASNKSQTQETDFEEIKVGSVSGKLPKALAEAVKNLERGFHSKSQEVAQKEKLLNLAQNDPKKFYQATGKDPYEFAMDLLAEKYELDSMSPEQKRMRELEERNKQFEQAEMSTKRQIIDQLREFTDSIPEGLEKKSKEELAEILYRRREAYQNEWTALDNELGEACKELNFPRSKQMLAKLAFEMMSSSKRGKPLTAKQAAAKVLSEYTNDFRGTIGAMEISKAVDFLGEDFVKKLREHDLQRVTEKSASKFGQSQQSPGGQQPASTSKKVYNEIEWRKAMGLE